MNEIDALSKEDLYLQVKAFILDHIRKGSYKADERLPTNREFSQMFKVSALTVQRAISDLMDDGIVYARRGKGTFIRDTQAAAQSRKATGLYACVFPSIHTNTVAAVVYALDSVIFDQAGHHMLLCNTQLDLEREVALLDSLLDRAVDALIYQHNPLMLRYPVFARAIDARLQKFLAAGVPVIMLDEFVKPDTYDTIIPDEKQTCALALRHLTDLGHRRMLFLAQKELFKTKIEAFRNCVGQLGLNPREILELFIDQDDIEQGVFKAMTRAYDEGWLYTGIVAATDNYALAAYRFLKSKGIVCPKDVSIVGADNLEFVERMEIALTTIWCQPAKVAQLVQQQIESRLGQGDLRQVPAQCLTVIPELLIRDTTDRLVL